MKKTQILSAIALAFALGVVAPIAVAENASAVTEATDSADGTATVADANKFKASVEASKQYKAVAALNTLVAELNKTGLVTATTDGGVTTYAAKSNDTLKSAITSAYDAVATANKVDNPATITGASFDQAISIAKSNIKNYETWVKALDTIAKTPASITTDNAKTLLEGYYKTLSGSTNYTAADYDTVKTAIEALDADNKIAAVVTAVSNAEEAVKNAPKLKTALESAKANGIRISGMTGATTFADFYGVAANAIAGTQGAAYSSLAETFKTLTDGMNDNAETQKTNFTTLKNLLSTVAALYDVDAASLTVSSIVAGYNPVVVTPSDDDKDDVNAPATGIAGTAEGTATTVSIVAGLATALTALGAGVVAYRSARRK